MNLRRRLKIRAIRVYQHLATLVGTERTPLSQAEPNAVILLAPDYGNVGDLAIRLAQERFLEAEGYVVHSIPLASTYRRLRLLRRRLGPSDLVTFIGGGNMGDIYPRAQLGREFATWYLRKHRQVSFPQSLVYRSRFDATANALREWGQLNRVSSNLIVVARETTSLNEMSRLYRGKLLLVPDIVLSLDLMGGSSDRTRSGVLLVLRDDSERVLTGDEHRILEGATKAFGSVEKWDHGVADERYSPNRPYELVNRYVARYQTARLVVTDRLHGMIFAAVTGTPCVVLRNGNHKIEQTYHDWIKDAYPNVVLIEHVSPAGAEEAARQVVSEVRASCRVTILDAFERLRQEVWIH